MWNKVKKFFQDIVDSLHNNDGGFSARKLTAIATMALVAKLDAGYEIYILDKGDASSYPYILGIHVLFILLLLSIITMEQVIKLKESNKDGSSGQ